MYHKILVALDESERAPSVLQAAVEVARLAGAQLYVLRVVTVPPEFPPAAAGTPTDPLVTQMTAHALQELSRLMARAPVDALFQSPIVKPGTPWKVILETSEDLEIDLIVLGSHGYHGWDRVLGTTAGKVANSATRDVLVVHRQKAPGADQKGT